MRRLFTLMALLAAGTAASAQPPRPSVQHYGAPSLGGQPLPHWGRRYQEVAQTLGTHWTR